MGLAVRRAATAAVLRRRLLLRPRAGRAVPLLRLRLDGVHRLPAALGQVDGVGRRARRVHAGLRAARRLRADRRRDQHGARDVADGRLLLRHLHRPPEDPARVPDALPGLVYLGPDDGGLGAGRRSGLQGEDRPGVRGGRHRRDAGDGRFDHRGSAVAAGRAQGHEEAAGARGRRTRAQDQGPEGQEGQARQGQEGRRQ